MDTAQAPTLRLLKQRPFVLFWLSRVAATVGSQMMALLIGWQVYALTGSAFDLGLVGLIQFVPSVVLTLLIGHAADRYDRRLIVRTGRLRACRADDHRCDDPRGADARSPVCRGVHDRLRPRFRTADRAFAGALAGAAEAVVARGQEERGAVGVER